VNQVVRLTEVALRFSFREGILAENLIHHWDEPNGVFKNRSTRISPRGNHAGQTVPTLRKDDFWRCSLLHPMWKNLPPLTSAEPRPVEAAQKADSVSSGTGSKLELGAPDFSFDKQSQTDQQSTHAGQRVCPTCGGAYSQTTVICCGLRH
jgi:hypothetical protein